jgi:hypothetical protein
MSTENGQAPTGRSPGIWGWAISVALLVIIILRIAQVSIAITEQMQNWPVLHEERDFPWYYLSAGQLLRGEDFYSGLQERARVELGIEDYFIDVAVSPPTFPLVIAPLALLSYPAAWGVWQFLSVAALILSVLLIARELSLSLSLPGWALLVFAILIFPPLTFHIYYAHTELFILLLLTGGWYLLRKDREVPAGVLLGLAAALRLYPLILLPYLFQRRAWKGLGAAIASGLGLAALAGWAAGPASYLRYLGVMREEIPVFYTSDGNLSLWGSVHKIAAIWPVLERYPTLRDALAYALFLAVVGLTLWLTRKASVLPHRLDHEYGLLIAAALLASPLSWIYYQVLLYLPMLILLVDLRKSETRHPGVLALLELGLFAATTPLLLGGRPDLPIGMQRLRSFLPTLTTLCIYLGLVLSRGSQQANSTHQMPSIRRI